MLHAVIRSWSHRVPRRYDLSMSEPGKREVAVQAAITVAAGLGAYAGPGAGALAAGAGVLALAGWQHVIGGRRLDNNVDTLLVRQHPFGV